MAYSPHQAPDPLALPALDEKHATNTRMELTAHRLATSGTILEAYSKPEGDQADEQDLTTQLCDKRDEVFDHLLQFDDETLFVAESTTPWHNGLNVGICRAFLLPASSSFTG